VSVATATEPSAPRLHRGEIVSAASALALLLTMFAFEWYGVDGIPGRATSRSLATAEDAWQVLTVTRWLMLATIGLALGSVIVHLGQRSHGTKTDTGFVIGTLGALTAVILTYRVLINLPSQAAVVDQKFGAFLGVLSAYGIACGGYQAMREERAHAGEVAHRSSRADTEESRRVAQ
jgi:hypothetical protein